MSTLLPTSIVGSLPKPSWLAQPETLWSPWRLEGDALAEGKQDALRVAVQEQARRGIQIISDGEQTRQHFVTTFIEHLSGVDFERRETVRIRDRYDASVPTVVGAVGRERPVFVDDARFLRGQTDQPIKWALPGPMIKANTDWKATLGSQWRQYEESLPLLQRSAIDIVSLECHRSHVPMELIELVRGKKVMLGAVDVASETIETPEEVADTLRSALEFVDADRLLPSTNCGMAPLPRDVALGKLRALSAGAAVVREELA